MSSQTNTHLNYAGGTESTSGFQESAVYAVKLQKCFVDYDASIDMEVSSKWLNFHFWANLSFQSGSDFQNNQTMIDHYKLLETKSKMSHCRLA